MNSSSLRTVVASIRHAVAGIMQGLRTQRNLRIHLLAALGTLAAGWWRKLDRYEWLAIVLAIGMVWTSELLNSAVEALADQVCSSYNERIKVVKDLAAGAVLCAAMAAAVVGIMVFTG